MNEGICVYVSVSYLSDEISNISDCLFMKNHPT